MGRAFEFRKARKMKRWSAMAKTFTRIGKDIVMAVKEGVLIQIITPDYVLLFKMQKPSTCPKKTLSVP